MNKVGTLAANEHVENVPTVIALLDVLLKFVPVQVVAAPTPRPSILLCSC